MFKSKLQALGKTLVLLIVLSNICFGDVEYSNLDPNADNYLDGGSSSKRWKDWWLSGTLEVNNVGDLTTVFDVGLENGDFADDSIWTFGGHWEYDDVEDEAQIINGSPDSQLQHTFTPIVGHTYSVTYTVKDRAFGTVSFTLGGQTGAWHNSNGTYTESITATTTEALYFGVSGSAPNFTTLAIDDVSVINLGSVTTGDVNVIGSGLKEASRINQGADNEGLEIYGYDDQDGNRVKIFIDSTGKTNIQSSESTIYKVGANNVIVFNLNSFDIYRLMRILDDVVQSFGTGKDYSWVYDESTDTLQLVDGFTPGSNIRLQLDSSGNILVFNKLAFTQTDLNEYIDSLNDGYMDYGATTGHRFSGGLTVDTDTLVVDDVNDRVGIGTSSPNSVFHIKANFPGWVGNNYAGQIIIQNPADSVFSNAVITGYESDGSGNPDQQLWYLGSSSTGNSDIIFLNRRSSKLALGTSGTSRLTILGNGNVGIGTDSPDANLQVVGDCMFGDDTNDTLISATGAITQTGTATASFNATTLSSLNVTGESLFSDKIKFTQTDGNEFIDSLNDGYMDYGATTGHRINMGGAYEYTLPVADGNADEILTTNGSGVLSFTRMAKAIYAELSDSNDQTFAVAGTHYSITFDTNDEISGITHSADTDTENITIVTTGVYTIFAQPQVAAAAGGAGTFHMWLQRNTGGGFVDIANTNIELSLASAKEDVVPLATTFLLTAGDIIRLRVNVSDNGIKLDAQAAIVGPPTEPEIPSIIFTMFMIGR